MTELSPCRAIALGVVALMLGAAGPVVQSPPAQAKTVHHAAAKAAAAEIPDLPEHFLLGFSGNATAQPVKSFEPAPVPDEDSLPPMATPRQVGDAEINPKIFHEKRQAETDGYARGSAPDETHDFARPPVAGVNLSIPVE
jgi:hypothetical protein